MADAAVFQLFTGAEGRADETAAGVEERKSLPDPAAKKDRGFTLQRRIY